MASNSRRDIQFGWSLEQRATLFVTWVMKNRIATGYCYSEEVCNSTTVACSQVLEMKTEEDWPSKKY